MLELPDKMASAACVKLGQTKTSQETRNVWCVQSTQQRWNLALLNAVKSTFFCWIKIIFPKRIRTKKKKQWLIQNNFRWIGYVLDKAFLLNFYPLLFFLYCKGNFENVIPILIHPQLNQLLACLLLPVPLCQEGEEWNGTQCNQCPVGTFKKNAGNTNGCEPCPLGEFAQNPGSAVCGQLLSLCQTYITYIKQNSPSAY